MNRTPRVRHIGPEGYGIIEEDDLFFCQQVAFSTCKVLMRFSEFVQLLETMLVDDFFQFAVWIVADVAVVVKNHGFSVRGGIRLPCRQFLNVGIARVSELCPCTAHQVGELEVGGCRSGYVAVGVVQAIEAEFEFCTMHGAFVYR